MSLVETLSEHEAAWEARPVLRSLYREWFELIRDNLSAVPGPTIELGAGLGRLREVVPEAIVTDVEPTPWASEVVDAQQLPYPDGSVANLVLLDVFHHLQMPSQFLDEAVRTLAPGGRVVMVEPYCSPISTFAYNHFHHEHVDRDAEPFADEPLSAEEAMDGSVALSTNALFRRRDVLEQRWPELRRVVTRRFSIVAYPLSGGFSRRSLLSPGALPALRVVERLLAPLAPLAAFRCLVVLERL